MSPRSSRVQRGVKRVTLAAVVLAVGSIVGVLAITPRPSQIEPSAVVVANESTARRAVDAYAARYTGVARHYAAGTSSVQRAVDTYAARYEAIARHYRNLGHSSQRGMAAYAARCTGLAQHYAATTE